MDISLSLFCLFIPKDTFSAFTRKGQRAVVYLQPSGPNGYCPVLQSPCITDAVYILAHLLPYRMTPRRPQAAGRVDAAATADTAKPKVATEHDFAYSILGFGKR